MNNSVSKTLELDTECLYTLWKSQDRTKSWYFEALAVVSAIQYTDQYTVAYYLDTELIKAARIPLFITGRST